MALTAEQLLLIREHIGSDVPPSDADLETYFELKGSIQGAVLYVLHRRLAELLAGAGSYSIAGVYSEDNDKVIAGLQKDIEQVENEGVGTSVAPRQSARLVRVGRSRSGRY